MDVNYPWWGHLMDRFMKNLDREEAVSELALIGNKCLDIACGDGLLLNKFLHTNYKELVGIDIAPDLIKEAKKNAQKNTEFVLAEIENFVNNQTSGQNKFDDIYMLAILEHIFWPSDFVKSASKLLKKGGRIIVELPNVAWLPHRLSLLRGKFPTTAPTIGVIPGVYDEHIRFFTLDTLDKMFADNGFKRIDLSCSGRLRQIKKLSIPLLAPDIIAVYQKVK